ncbi:hypothetical protein ElyMa_001777000 [Elysia marginata]|uniref:Apple domain-containing protein n=1 Tax=Elysia marginata TaxID=1093978 RepID=A0AAV4EDN3_9GAST|nr:hypothetical protein ElyMa_001777000 [Elysia marginata]
MVKSYNILENLLVLCLFVCIAQSRLSHQLLTFCKDDVDIEKCATTHLDTSISIYDIFDTMTTNVSRLEEMCENTSFYPCIGACVLEFRASIYSHLDNVCTMLRWIDWEEECWTEQWAVEARRCYRWIYPNHRTANAHHGLYPVPYRVYDRAVIARDCFPTASDTLADKCSYYQTWIFQQLLPQYFELHGYPEGFDHIQDTIGFPGL